MRSSVRRETVMRRGRDTAVVVLAAIAMTAAACGGSAGSPAASAPPTAAAPATATPAQFDTCVVGTWKSTTVSGTIDYQDVGGASSVPLTGGSGDVFVIKSDTSYSLDFSGDTPERGTGNDGAAYVVTTTGRLVGTAATSGGELTLVTGTGSTDKISLTRNGAAFRSGSIMNNQVFGYTCSRATSLKLTQGGITYTYLPG